LQIFFFYSLLGFVLNPLIDVYVGWRMGSRVWESTDIRNGERSGSYGAVLAAFTSFTFVHQLCAWP